MQRRFALLGLLVALLLTASVSAQPSDSAPDELDEAMAIFQEGRRLHDVGDCEGALPRYLASYELLPAVPNVLNAALCLIELGRYDEAYDRFAELVARFDDELTDEERAAIGPEMKKLRSRLGQIDVVGTDTGTLLVDGRERGSLPLSGPVYVLPGERDVRVVADGYEPFGATVAVEAQATVRVEVKLSVIEIAGRLRVGGADGASVLVDGANVGTSPWEGTLAAGDHVLQVVRDDEGSAPAKVTVVEGQLAMVEPELAALGPELTISTDPPTAVVSVNGVVLGADGWRGRLPRGEHALLVREDGYFDDQRTVSVTADGPASLAVELEVDEEHPRWGVSTGLFVFDLMGGVALVPSLGSGAEDTCADASCSDNPLALGGLVGASAGYEFDFGMSVEIGGGYFLAQKTVARERPFAEGTDVLSDDITLSGGFVGAGLGYRWTFAEPFELRPRLFAGAVFTRTVDSIESSARDAAGTYPTSVTDAGTAVRGTNVLVMPEVRLGARWSGFGVSVGFAAAIVMLPGPTNSHGGLRSAPTTCDANPMTAACATARTFTQNEAAHSAFVMLLPNAGVSYAF